MLDIEIRKRIVKILELALEKNGNTKIWVDYSGHVDFLTVRVIENYDSSIDYEYTMYKIYKRFINLNNERYYKSNIEELDEVIKMLESIETKKVDIINNTDQITKSSV